ncbi:MAG: nucleotidyltransferase domain-containing protein [Acidobacteria bacterium]|nr:nucleotidyltransferase domain-containing protein [Acidobacteriota bacterium]
MQTATVEAVDSKTEWYRIENQHGQRLAYIKRLCKQISDAFAPEQIILFGSQAYGTPTPDSDIDLLVVMHYESSHSAQAIQILNQLNVLAPIDLLVRSPEEVRERIEIGDNFMREIFERGKVMYEAAHARMD